MSEAAVDWRTGAARVRHEPAVSRAVLVQTIEAASAGTRHHYKVSQPGTAKKRSLTWLLALVPLAICFPCFLPALLALAGAGLLGAIGSLLAGQVLVGLLAALGQYSDHRLPELFAGYSRQEISFPVEYPTASRPQAWASGSVFLLLSAMLGVHPSTGPLEPTPFLPSAAQRIRLDALWTGQGRANLEVVRSGEGVRRRVFHGSFDRGAP